MLNYLRRIQFSRFGWGLIAVMLLAAILRFGWPGVVEFKYDEAMISRRAIALAQQGIWPASTISSIPGIPQPPMKALLLAVPYAFTRNPAVAAAFQGLLGVITVGLTAWFGRRYFNARVGLLAAALLAAAPWAIFYDRKLWSENVPLLTLLMMIGLYGYLVDRKPRLITLALALLGALIGFYLADTILGAVVGLGILLFPRATFRLADDPERHRPLIWLAVGMVALIFTLVPFGLEIATGPADWQAAQSQPSNGARQLTLFDQIDLAAAVGTGYYFQSLAGDRAAEFDRSLPVPDLSDFIDLPSHWLVAAGMLYVVARSVIAAARRKQSASLELPRYGLLALWIAVPIGVWTLTGMPAYPHRYIMMYPAQLLAAALLIDNGANWAVSRWPSAKKPVMGLIAIGVGALTIWHSLLYASMLDFVSTHDIVGGHGRPVSELWSVAEEARGLAKPDAPIVVYSEGDDPEYDNAPAQFDALLGDQDIRFVANPAIQVLPTRASVAIVHASNQHYRVEQHPRTPESPEAGLARLDNGLDILRVEQPDNDAALFVITFRVWASPPVGKNFGYSVQLLDASDQKIGGIDGAFLRSAYWRPGETIIVSTRIAGTATGLAVGDHLMISLYAYISETEIEGVNILDIAGNPAGQQVIIPLR